jgi:hypothetical protein
MYRSPFLHNTHLPSLKQITQTFPLLLKLPNSLKFEAGVIHLYSILENIPQLLL